MAYLNGQGCVEVQPSSHVHVATQRITEGTWADAVVAEATHIIGAPKEEPVTHHTGRKCTVYMHVI